jgi:hypothetical protein
LILAIYDRFANHQRIRVLEEEHNRQQQLLRQQREATEAALRLSKQKLEDEARIKVFS